MPKAAAQAAPPSLPAPRLLPWHAAALEHIETAWRADRLPHAVLLHGAEGLGKAHFAAWLAAALLCERADRALAACGQCAACKLMSAGTHPDLAWIGPEEGKQQISVEQVRGIAERLAMTSYRQGRKLVIVEPAHQMTTSAANGLLKTLEEPTPKSLLLLITSRPSALPATVRSRCQRLVMRTPPREQAETWLREAAGKDVPPQVLQFAGGAPLAALASVTDGSFAALDADMTEGMGAFLLKRADVVQVAGAWADEHLTQRLAWLDRWLMGLAREAIAGTADPVTFGPRTTSLPGRRLALNISVAYDVIDRLREFKLQLTRTALQKEAALISLLIALSGAVTAS
jgi:DNA polymerase III subunit delta'